MSLGESCSSNTAPVRSVIPGFGTGAVPQQVFSSPWCEPIYFYTNCWVTCCLSLSAGDIVIAKNWQLMKTGDTCSEIILVCPRGLLSYFACNKRMPEDLCSLCIDHMYLYTQLHARHAIYIYGCIYLLQICCNFKATSVHVSPGVIFLKYNLPNKCHHSSMQERALSCWERCLWSCRLIPSADHPALMLQALMLAKLFRVLLTDKWLSLLISITSNSKSFVNREHH